MINLQFGLIHFLQIYEAAAAVFLHELLFDSLGKASPPAKSMELILRCLGKTIGGNFTTICSRNPKRLELNSQFTHISSGAGWMVVAILGLQLFRRDMPVLKNVIYDRFRAFRRN